MNEPEKPKTDGPKVDDLSAEHLDWLIESRARNQRASGKLFRLLEQHEAKIKEKKLSPTAQALVAASFSLWRAAFLADRTGKSVFKDAKHFLAKMLIDNAINYTQDRAARDWTFNYYVSVAESELLNLSIEWQSVTNVFDRPDTDKNRPYAKRRWDRCQKAFEAAIRRFTKELEKL